MDNRIILPEESFPGEIVQGSDRKFYKNGRLSEEMEKANKFVDMPIDRYKHMLDLQSKLDMERFGWPNPFKPDHPEIKNLKDEWLKEWDQIYG